MYSATVTGPTSVSPGALSTIVSSINGLDSVINYAEGVIGRNMESDAELRAALYSRQKHGSGNEVAIQNEIYNIEGVTFAKVFSNRDITYYNNRPPKSFEVVVIGGDEQAIADKIFAVGPAGIQAYGTITKTVVDADGYHWDIGFSRPVNKYIWVKVVYTKNSEEDLPLNVITAIQDAITSWSKLNVNVGVDIIYQKLYRPIYDITGIAFADVKIVSTYDLTPPADSDYAAENIVVGEVEIGLFDSTRITIQEMV
jgi:uncharacterized phage protein gp47/JayE